MENKPQQLKPNQTVNNVLELAGLTQRTGSTRKVKQALSAIRLTDAEIGEYQELYLQTFGTPISKDEALVQGLALVRLVKTISQVDDYEKGKNNDNE